MQASFEEVRESLINKMREKFGADKQINEQSNIALDLNLDSLQMMELVADMEDHFMVSVPLESISEIKTVSDAARLIYGLSEKSS